MLLDRTWRDIVEEEVKEGGEGKRMGRGRVGFYWHSHQGHLAVVKYMAVNTT